MTKTKTKIMGSLMAALLIFSAPLVYADNGNDGDQGWGYHQGRHEGHMKGGFFRDLTDDQKKQLKDIFQKQREAGKAVFEQIKADRETITNELLQTTPDVNKINDLKSKIEVLQAQAFDNRINSTLEVKKILNAEQFAKYLEFQKHRKGWQKHCRHHHREHNYHHDNE